MTAACAGASGLGGQDEGRRLRGDRGSEALIVVLPHALEGGDLGGKIEGRRSRGDGGVEAFIVAAAHAGGSGLETDSGGRLGEGLG